MKFKIAFTLLLAILSIQPALAGYTPPDKEDGSPDRTGDAGSELVLGDPLPSPPPGDNRRD